MPAEDRKVRRCQDRDAEVCRAEKDGASKRRNGHRPHPLMTSLRSLVLAIPIALLLLAVAITSAQAPRKTPAHPRPSRNSAPSGTGFVPDFVDVAQRSGLDFHLTCGGPEKRYIME